jgi:hypothetical protein
MVGDVSVGGVYVPALLFLAVLALGITTELIRLLTGIGFYRLIAARPLVDLSLFVAVLWAASQVGKGWINLP